MRTLLAMLAVMLTMLTMLTALSALSAQQGPTPAAPANFVRMNGVVYAQGTTGPLLADLYLPKTPALVPAIIFIHGGGWIHGSRASQVRLIGPLVEHGYVGMAIDYDLSPGVRFPVALEQCKEAVRWLRAHAAEYHVDPARIAVEGGSAGGELAAMVALTGDDARYDRVGGSQGVSSAVKAALLYSSDLNLLPFAATDESIVAYLGGSCAEHMQLCLDASPQAHLGGKLPPIFIGQGNADEDVPYSQFVNFVAAYQKAGGPITPYTAEGGLHNYVYQPQWFQANLDATLQFLAKHL